MSKRLLNIVVFGYPGSGRGSQSVALAEKYGLEFVATGRMLDDEISRNARSASKIRQLYEDGELVPDEIVVRLIEQKLEQTRGTAKGYIFKGYPRTLVQSYILDGLLKKHGSSTQHDPRDRRPHARTHHPPRRPLEDRPLHALRHRPAQDRQAPARTRGQDRAGDREIQEAPRRRKVDGRGSFDEVFERTSSVLESLFRAG